MSRTDKSARKVAVIGLGYVGLPVAIAFARSYGPVIGFDIDPHRIDELKKGFDRTREVSAADLSSKQLSLTADIEKLREADFFIITVPTPIDHAHRPDLTALLAASELVGRVMSKGAIVVYESTVYPGATEEDCVPALERVSGLKSGRDFSVGYSPERINPGDMQHRFETIKKVVSGQDEKTLGVVAELYESVVTAGVHRASSIKVAEAAKVIENAQRDLNIAFMNELSTIFRLLDIDTHDVLSAASTKWNFLNFTPGLVGGHCIGVDPYYLSHRAEIAGYYPEIILAGRRINENFASMITRECVRMLLASGKTSPRVSVLGLTFKENVPDIRNSRVRVIVDELRSYKINVSVCDPVADAELAKSEYGIDLTPMEKLAPSDAVIFAVPHAEFLKDGWKAVTAALGGERGIVLDVKAKLPREKCPQGVTLWRP